MIYMDNGEFSCNNLEALQWSFGEMQKIFEPYKFALQQFVTNDSELQMRIDNEHKVVTPVMIKMFGMSWDKEHDTISTLQLKLDQKASTKRLFMSSLKSVYDTFNIYGPIMNRGNLFLQKLITDKSLEWDTILPENLQREWKNIVKQANATPSIEIKRFVGNRNSHCRLGAITDRSRDIYATVLYIQDTATNQVRFLTGKKQSC